MERIFVNSEYSKTSEPHRFRLDFYQRKLIWKILKKHGFSKFDYLLHLEKHKTEYNNNKFKSLALTWNDTFDLPYGSYSILDI